MFFVATFMCAAVPIGAVISWSGKLVEVKINGLKVLSSLDLAFLPLGSEKARCVVTLNPNSSF